MGTTNEMGKLQRPTSTHPSQMKTTPKTGANLVIPRRLCVRPATQSSLKEGGLLVPPNLEPTGHAEVSAAKEITEDHSKLAGEESFAGQASPE